MLILCSLSVEAAVALFKKIVCSVYSTHFHLERMRSLEAL